MHLLRIGETQIFMYSPFAIITRVIQKMIKAPATSILVVSDWHNQPWHTVFNAITISDTTIYLRIDLLLLPQSKKIHPLKKSLVLIAILVSGI